MLRDKSLIPLSHQHQRALALCVRIERAQPIPAEDLQAWQVEIAQLFGQEIDIHFAAEESVIFPAAQTFSGLLPLVKELIAEHVSLRELFRQAESQYMSAQNLSALGQQLAAHIRKEERQLFESIQQLMNALELAAIGLQLETALKDSIQSCILPDQVAKLKPAR